MGFSKYPIVIIICSLMIAMFNLIIVAMPNKTFSDPLWEIVPTPNSSAEMMRTAVPHGWIVSYKSLARGMVYVPDEKHEWNIKIK